MSNSPLSQSASGGDIAGSPSSSLLPFESIRSEVESLSDSEDYSPDLALQTAINGNDTERRRSQFFHEEEITIYENNISRRELPQSNRPRNRPCERFLQDHHSRDWRGRSRPRLSNRGVFFLQFLTHLEEALENYGNSRAFDRNNGQRLRAPNRWLDPDAHVCSRCILSHNRGHRFRLQIMAYMMTMDELESLIRGVLSGESATFILENMIFERSRLANASNRWCV